MHTYAHAATHICTRARSSSSSSSSGSEAGTSSPVQEKNKEQKPLETEEVQPTGSSPQEAEADYFASEELISELKTDFGKRGGEEQCKPLFQQQDYLVPQRASRLSHLQCLRNAA